MRDIINEKSRSEWIALVNEWIHDEKDRTLIIRHLLDGITLAQCGEEIGLEPRQTARRYKKAKMQLAKHI